MGAVVGLLLVPPVNCLVVACLGAVFWRRRAGRVAAAAGLAALFLFALPIVPSCLIYVLEAGLNQAPPAGVKPKAIVILSGDETETRVGPATTYQAGALTLEREQAGAELARRTGLPILVSGGALHPWSPPLADMMAASLARDFGVRVTWREASSLDTWGNARLSAAMLRNNGIGTIYLVTHAWHMKRALLAFRRAGLTAIPAPAYIDAPPSLRATAFLPLARAWLESYYAMHELIGWAWYAIRP